MKTKPHLLLAALLALGTSAYALAQDTSKPTPPAPADAAAATPAPPAGSPPPPPTPGGRPPEQGRRPEGPRHGEGPHGFEGERHGEGPRGEGPRGEGPQHGDWGHHAEGGHHPEFGQHFPGGPAVPPKPTPFIGVVTSPLPPALTAQLGLNEGFGLVVGEVLPDSPAAKAGLQRYDVITKFNDQLLVDAGQFAALVRAAGKDADATLTFLRKAQEQKAPVKIGERLLPIHPPVQGGGDFHRNFDHSRGPGPGEFQRGPERSPERSRGEFENRMREFHQRMQEWQKKPHAENMPQPPTLDPTDILKEVQPGGVAQIQIVQPDGTVTYRTAEAKVNVKDNTGEIIVSTQNGQRQLLAKNAQGETVFDGPINTDEQLQALPEDVRRKVELIEVRTQIAQAEPTEDVAFEPELDVQ